MNSVVVRSRVVRVATVLMCMILMASALLFLAPGEVSAAGRVNVVGWSTWNKDFGGFTLDVQGYSAPQNVIVTLTFNQEVHVTSDLVASGVAKISGSGGRKITITIYGYNGKKGDPDGGFYFNVSGTNIEGMKQPKCSAKASGATYTPTQKPTATNTPTAKPTKKPTNTSTPTPKPTKKPTNTPKPTKEATPTPEPTDAPAPTATPEPTSTPVPTPTTDPDRLPIESEPSASAVVPGTVDPTDTTDPTNPGGGTTDKDGNTPTPTKAPETPVELKKDSNFNWLPYLLVFIVVALLLLRYGYLRKGKGYSNKEAFAHFIPGMGGSGKAPKPAPVQASRPVASSQTGAGLAASMKEINAMRMAEQKEAQAAGAGAAATAKAPQRAPVKRPAQFSANPNVAQQAKIQAEAPKRPAAAAVPPKAAPAASAPAITHTAPVAATTMAGVAAAQTQPQQKAPVQAPFTPAKPAAAPSASSAAPGLKPPIKRPPQYSVNHAAQAPVQAQQKPVTTHVAPVVAATAATVAGTPKAAPAAPAAAAPAKPVQGVQIPAAKAPSAPVMPVPEQSGTKHFKRPSEYSVDHTAIPGVVKMPEVKIASDVKPASADKIAAKNEVHPQAGKDPAPRKVAPAPAKAPAPAVAAKPVQQPVQQAAKPEAPAEAKGHGVKGLVGKLPFGKKHEPVSEPVAYPKTASTSGTTNYAAAMKEIAAQRRAEEAAAQAQAKAPAAQQNPNQIPGLRAPIKRPPQYSVNHAAQQSPAAQAPQAAAPMRPGYKAPVWHVPGEQTPSQNPAPAVTASFAISSAFFLFSSIIAPPVVDYIYNSTQFRGCGIIAFIIHVCRKNTFLPAVSQICI